MNYFFQTIAFATLSYATRAYNAVINVWNSFWDWYSYTPILSPNKQYFLSNHHVFNESYGKVPPDTIYIEEWIQKGEKRCIVLYENEMIPQIWTSTPFSRHGKCNWLWVGDRNSEIDMTHVFNKFLVPGNRIRPELVEKIAPNSKIVYIESGTFNELEFPSEGLLIKANGDE